MEFVYDLKYTIGWIPLFIIGIYNLIHPRLKIRKLISLIFICTFGFLAGAIYSQYIMLITVLIVFIYIYHLYHNLTPLLMLPLTYIIIVIIDNILELLFYTVLHTDHRTLTHTPITFLFTICEAFIDYWITYFISKKLHKYVLRRTVQLPKKLLLMLFLNLILCSAIIAVNVFAGAKLGYQSADVTFTIILCVIFFILSSLLLIYSIRSTHEAVMAKEKLKQYEHLKQYTENLEQTYNNLRSFKHDYVNIIASISSYLEEKQYERLTKYFYKHIVPTRQKLVQNTESLNKLMHIRQLEIKSLLSYKLMYALEQGISVHVDIPNDIEVFRMEPVEFTRILGIYLDNAIEAAHETSKPSIELHIADCGTHTAILLSNTFLNHGLSVADMTRLNTSTKGKDRGIGLANVQIILGRYPEIFHETYIRDNFFIQHLELPNA